MDLEALKAMDFNATSGSWMAMSMAVSQVSAEATMMQVNYGECLDTIWMLLAGTLVVFMHPGFSLLEAGSVRFKNTQNILTKNFIVICLGFLSWYFWGWAFALGSSDNKWGGATGFSMKGFLTAPTNFRVWFFQGAFCATAGTIVSGAMAERTMLKGFGIYTFILTSLIYPLVVYWGWSGAGFLNYPDPDDPDTLISFVGPGLMDFAGSGIVHMTGGVGALVGCLAVGARKGRWEPEKQDEFTGHSVPFCVLGTFFLWFGWYGFNPGSTLSMSSIDAAYTAGLVAVNTTLAPCAAGLVVFLLRALVVAPKCLDVCGFCNGILAGLVGITSACGSVAPWEAVLIGFIAGFIYQGASMLIRKLGIDDVVDAIPVHGACGLWGLLCPGIFGSPDLTGGNGFLHGGDQFGTQIVTALIIMVWVGVSSTLILVPLRLYGWLRMSDEFQDKGADVMEHSPAKAYNEDNSKLGES